MKVFLSIIAICLGIIPARAYNTSEVFQEGTHWHVNASAFAFNPDGSVDKVVSWPEIEVLEGKANILGKECSVLWRYCDSPSEKQLIAYIYADNEKVYFANPVNPEAWNLLYDFNIVEGDTFAYKDYSFDLSQEGTDLVFKCNYIYTDEIFGALPTIALSIALNGDDFSPWNDTCWIKGIGSIYGLSHPTKESVGVGYSLKKVWNEDKVFVEVKTSGIQMPEHSDIGITTNNNTIQIAGTTPGSVVKVFDIWGNIISENTVLDKTLSIPVDLTGIYLIQVNNQVFKTFVR